MALTLCIATQAEISFCTQYTNTDIDSILPKGPYQPCLRMADRALLAGYPRYTVCNIYKQSNPNITHWESSTKCQYEDFSWYSRNIFISDDITCLGLIRCHCNESAIIHEMQQDIVSIWNELFMVFLGWIDWVQAWENFSNLVCALPKRYSIVHIVW